MKLRISLTIMSLFSALAAEAQSGNADIKCDTSKFKFRAVTEIGFIRGWSASCFNKADNDGIS